MPDTELVTSQWSFRGIDELLASPRKPWLIQELVKEGDLAMSFGDSNTGKTLTLIDLICRAAKGEPVFGGRFALPRPLVSLYLYEEGASGIQDRFSAALDFHEIDVNHPARRRIFWDDKLPKFFSNDPETCTDSIVAYIREFEKQSGIHIDLIFLDTLSDAAEGTEERDNSQARKVMSEAARLGREVKAVPWFIHHAPKDGAGTPRGASAYRAKCDLVLEVSGDANPHTIRCNKLRDGEKFKDFQFTISKRLDSAIVEYPPSGEEMGLSRRTSKEELITLLRDKFSCEPNAQTANNLNAMLVRPFKKIQDCRDHLSECAHSPHSCVQVTLRHGKTATGQKTRQGLHYWYDLASEVGAR